MRVDSNVEAADELAVVQAIVPAAVRLGHADDNETMVIGQDMLLWGKSNRVPALGLAVVVPLNLRLLC